MQAKQWIAIIGLMMLPGAVIGQDRPMPEPEYIGVFYVYDGASATLVNLERQRASPAAKAKALGFGGVKATLEIPGGRSTVRFPADRKLAFVFKAAAGLDPQTLAQIVNLTPQKYHREIPQMQSKGFMGLGGIKSEGNRAEVDLSVSKYTETAIQVSPVGQLPPGEYAIRRPSSPSVFCFGIDPPRSAR